MAAQSHGGGLDGTRAALGRKWPRDRSTHIHFIHWEQGFGPRRVNIGRMIDFSALGTTMLANFITVRFPRQEQVWVILEEDLDFDVRIRCLGRALRAELLSIRCHRENLRVALFARGHRQFLDYVESDPVGGWRIHLFVGDADALALVASITTGHVGPGDPISLDPRAFIERRLSCIEKCYRLTGRYDWLDDDLP